MRDKLESISRRIRRSFQPAEKPPAGFPIAYKEQIHEREIVKYFNQDGHNLFDKEHEAVVPANVVLCFTNRCGSNWLSALMAATGLIGHADEFFNAPRLLKTAENTKATSFSTAFKNQALAKTEQTEGRFITKLSWDQLFFFAKTRIIPDMMPNTKFIQMHRRDKAGQALSMCVAEQTGQWTSIWNSGKKGKRDLDRITDLEIQNRIDEVTFKDQQFERYFGTFGSEVVTVYYEDIVENPLREITRLVAELGLNPDGKPWELDESKVKLSKQSDEQSQKRLAVFYKNMQNHGALTAEAEAA